MTRAIESTHAPEARVALVLSGGGARGAYEAGVLSYIFGDLSRRLKRRVHFDIVTGSSVGAIHAAYVAALQGEENMGERLMSLWRSLSIDSIFSVGVRDVLRIPWQLIWSRPGGAWSAASGRSDRLGGLFNTEPLEQLVLSQIPWDAIQRNLREGRLEALAVIATEIATGRSVVFVDNASGAIPPWTRDPFIIARPAQIAGTHTLASAAIPLLFPAVRVAGTFYCDGGLRLNTPLVPALRLGAKRVLIIGLRHRVSPGADDQLARKRESNFGSLPYLAGKALNALLLDRVDTDVDRLRLFNAVLECGRRAYGDDFLERINEPIVRLRNVPYQIVPELYVQPSKDLSALAGQCLRHQPRARGLHSWFTRRLAHYSARGAAVEADLLSYLLFDRCYAEHLIELGRSDAAAIADDLAQFL